MYPDAFGEKEKPAPTQDTTGFKAALSAGATRLGGEFELLKGKAGIKSEADAQKEYEAAQAKAAARFTPTEDGWTESPFLKFRETLGGSLPYMAAPAAAGLAALAAPVAAPVAAGLGLLGAGAVSTGQFTGSNLAAQMETGKTLEQTSGAAALGAAIPQALLDTAAMALIPGVGKLFGSVGSKLTTEQARAIANQTLSKAAMDYTAKTGAAMTREGFTETVQQVLERLQAGTSLTDPEARKEYIDSFIGGAVLGGAIAPAGRYIERSGAQTQAAKADREDRNAAAAKAAEQERAIAAQEEAKRQTPEYALEVANKLKTLEQEKIALQQQVRKVSKDSPTEAEDKAFNRDIQAQLKANAASRSELAPEVNRLKQAGTYQQALEQERVKGMSPMDYLLERTGTVRDRNVAPGQADTAYEESGLAFQDPLVPSVERRKAQEAEQARVAGIPAAYAAERMELARTQTYDPTGEDFVEYLLQDPYKAGLLLENKIPLPGLTASESNLIRKEVAKRLKAMSKEELAARQAELQGQKTGEAPANPMAAFMEQSEALDTDRRQGVTDSDIAFTERQAAMPRDVIQQGELFGARRVGQAAGVVDRREIGRQVADLQRQLEIAYAQRNVDKGGQYREKIRELTEQIRDLQERAALPTEGALGEATAGIQEQLGQFPESLEAKRAAEAAREEALMRVARAETDSADAVIASVLDEIKSARPDLRPETLTEIGQKVRGELGALVRYGANPDVLAYTNARLDAISQKWRSGTERGETFTKAPTPTQTSPEMLQEQMDRAFAQRERYDADTLSVLEQLADNLKVFSASPERRNMAGEWLNRVMQTGRSSPEMTADVRSELARLEEGKLQESGQQELPERFMPKEIEGKAPEKKATAFATAAEFQKYLASDALKLVRQALGMGKDTASRMHARLGVFQKRIDGITKQLANLEERKKALQAQRGVESNTAKDLLNTAEANLKKVYERLDTELLGLQVEYMQARQQFDFTAQTVADIGQKIADNLVAFQSTDNAVVAAAQKTADAKTAYAVAIEQPVTKRNFSTLRTTRREIITSLEQQIAATRKAEADTTILQFLTADLNLQMQLQAEEKALDRDAQVLLNAGLALEEAAATQKRSRNNQKELKQAQQELAAALDVKGAVDKEVGDLDTQIAKVGDDIAAAEKQLARTQQAMQPPAAPQENPLVTALESIKIEPLTKAERDAKLAEDKQALEAFQKSTAALAALPGERIDFSKRQEMLELLRVSNKDSDQIDAKIKEIEAGIEEMQAQVDSAVAQALLSKEYASDDMSALNKKINEGNQRIAALKAALVNYEKAKARKLVAENKARVLLSGDPEVTQDIDKRINKLVANIQNQDELAQQTVNPKTGKPVPEQTVKDRAKTLARYKRELQVLTGVRSNRLGIKRIDVTTGAATKDLRTDKKTGQTTVKAKKASIVEQEQIDAEIERLQEYGKAKERLSAMKGQLEAMKAAKEPRGKAKQEERAEKIRELQEKVNAQQAEVDRLTPKKVGAVSQATKIESSAPAKFRAGTAETKAEKGTSKRPIVETRTVGQPTSEEAIADANAFAERLTAAKTDAQRTKLMLEQDETTRVQLEDALYDRVQDLKNRVLKLEEERRTLTGAKGMTAIARLKSINRELTGKVQEAGELETSGLYYYLQVAEKNLADFEESLAKAEAAAEAKEDAERAEYGARITELGAVDGGTEIAGFDMGISDTTGDFDFDSRYRTAKTTGPSMSVAQVQKAYDALTGEWVNKPPTVIVAEESGLPVRILNQAKRDNMLGKVPGLYDPKSGKVYLVAANLRSVNDVILTTVHEIAGHFGLQKVLGETYNQTMNAIYNGNAAIRKIADSKVAEMPSLSRETATEEALAERAELDPNAPDTRSAMRRIYDTLKKFLRDVLGLKDAVTDAQINQIIANARKFVIQGGEAGKGAAPQTNTPAFKKWFGDSKIVNPDGKPLVVYHGTGADFEIFDSARSPVSGAYHGKGFYFGDAGTAEAFAGEENQRIMPVYLRMENPFTGKLTAKDVSTLRKQMSGFSDVYDTAIKETEGRTPSIERLGVLSGDRNEFIQKALKTAGYDGRVVLPFDGAALTDPETEFVVFDSNQIKSAVGNRGTFDAGNPNIMYRSKATAPANALESLAQDITAKPKTLKEKLSNNLALQSEMQAVDMRAGLRDTLKFGDDNLFTQAMYHVRKAEQKMAQMFTVMNNGPLVAYKDEKGLVGYRSSNKNSAREVFDAIADIPVADPQLKTNIAQAYMVAQRAQNKGLSKLDFGELGVTEEKLKDALAAADANPALKSALENVRRKYNAYNKGLIEFLASSGRIPKKVAADLLKDGDYVPYYRVRENGMADLNFGNNVTFNVGDIRRQPYLAELKGGETKLLPLNEAIQQNTLLLTDMALTNNAAKSVAYGLQALGKGMGPVDPKTGQRKNAMPIKTGTGPADARTIRFYQEPDPNDSEDTGERHIVVNTKGTLAEGIPSELVVQSLEGSSLALPGFLKLGGVAADLLRSGVTRTPLYIARKLLREPMAASFTGGLNSNTFSSIFKAGAEYVRMVRGTSETEAKLIEKGLIQSNIFAGDMSDMKKMALQLASGKDQNALEKVLAAADRYAMRADAATLALVLKNAQENGLSEVEADMATMESMNFYKRGLSPTLQYASRLIPFFNAQIQGLNVLVKAARGNMPFEEQQQIKRKFFNNALLLTATGLAYAMAMEDDETFRNARPRDKYSNFFLPLPGVDEPLKLPIPFEAGYFYSLAVAAVDAMRAETDGKAQWQAIKDLFLGSVPGYSSMGMPQIAKPAFEVWTNKNFLTGGPVESLRLQGLNPEERYLATTTDLAKQMSKALPLLSPIQIEHLVRGYLGVLPLAAAAGANSLFEREGKGEKPEGRASDLPLVGTAFQKKYGGADADVVFREAKEAEQTRNTLNNMVKEGRREEAIEFRDAHRAELALAPLAGQYRQVVGRINQDIRRTQERNDLTPQEKRIRLDALEKAKQDRADAFLKAQRTIEDRVQGGKT